MHITTNLVERVGCEVIKNVLSFMDMSSKWAYEQMLVQCRFANFGPVEGTLLLHKLIIQGGRRIYSF